jgi:hypothetical protein
LPAIQKNEQRPHQTQRQDGHDRQGNNELNNAVDVYVAQLMRHIHVLDVAYVRSLCDVNSMLVTVVFISCH